MKHAPVLIEQLLNSRPIKELVINEKDAPEIDSIKNEGASSNASAGSDPYQAMIKKMLKGNIK